MMSLKKALARADRLCPPDHPSGRRVLFTVSSRPIRSRKGEPAIPKAELEEQLTTAEAIGVLAEEVRRLRALEKARAKLRKASLGKES
jgi:hypothetical protein